jgi:hypothetical protein
MKRDIDEAVKECSVCQIHKGETRPTPGSENLYIPFPLTSKWIELKNFPSKKVMILY